MMEARNCVPSPAIAIFLLLIVAFECGCTTTYAYRATNLGSERALQQPLRDLSVMRDEVPVVLQRAAEAPYQLPPESVDRCQAVRKEIAILDEVLGSDVDVEAKDSDRTSATAGGILSGAINSVVGLPFRGAIRTVSGAAHRERILHAAITAGMVRRGFLKGVAPSFCETALTS